MASLVEQLQRDASDDNVRVATTLRRMKIAAFKLNLGSVETWVDHELKGYGLTDVPSYRIVPGRLRAFNPFRGWIPVTGPVAERLSNVEINQSINSIEDLLSLDPADNLGMAVSPGLANILDDGFDVRFGKYQWRLGRSNIVSIVDNVRSLALDWAIELERRGITGSGMSFTDEEKNLAKNSGSNITVGPNATIIGNLGQGNTSGHIVAYSTDATAVLGLLDQIAPHRENLIASGVSADSLDSALAKLREECGRPTPNQGFIKAALTNLRNTVSGAAGSLIASGIVATITTLLSAPAH